MTSRMVVGENGEIVLWGTGVHLDMSRAQAVEASSPADGCAAALDALLRAGADLGGANPPQPARTDINSRSGA